MTINDKSSKMAPKSSTSVETDSRLVANQINECNSGATNQRSKHSDIQRAQQAQVNPEQEEQAEMAKRAAKYQKKWNRRLKIFFCCLGYKKNKDSIADVASIFAEFYADLNVPSSELAAGFVLLSKYQSAQRQWILKNELSGIEQYLSGVLIRADTNYIDISIAEDSHLINDLIYYMNYSLAIFGWPMQMVDDPCMLCCICPYLKITPCCSSKKSKRCSKLDKVSNVDRETKETSKSKADNSTDVCDSSTADRTQLNNNHQNGRSVVGQLNEDCDVPIILEDNCCSCNSASAETRLSRHNYEIIYISYRCSVNVIPFLVAADHSKQTIVVALRGSMSLSDMVTDMNGQVDKVPIENCPDDWLGHRGIMRAADYVKTTLIQERILERAFSCRLDLGSQDYNLILCGHSLGAGAAAILGILLRPLYQNLKAYLYSPPGGILSMPAVEYTKQFAIGIILGNDTVPRLGVAQLERLRYHTLLSLKSSQKSPSKILAKALCPTCCFGGNEVDYDPSQSLDLLHGTGGRSFDYNGNKIPFQAQPHVLYVPGKLIHVVKNHSFKSKTRRFFNDPIYQAIWTDNSDYDRIIISDGMFLDHLPNNLMHAMKMLFSKTLPGRRDSKLSGAVELMNEVQLENPTQYSENPREGCNASKSNNPMAERGADNVPSGTDMNNNGDTSDELNNNDENDDENNNVGRPIKISPQICPGLRRHEYDFDEFSANKTKASSHDEQEVNSIKDSLDENGNEKPP